MNKLNKNQKASRNSGFNAMRPRGREHFKRGFTARDNFKPFSEFTRAFPLAEPVPIAQMHTKRGDGKMIIASSLVHRGVDDSGKQIVERVPVCRHKCTYINTRHTPFTSEQMNGSKAAA